jgi:hypothetical protein
MGKDALKVQIASKFDKWWKQPFGLSCIQVDLFTWEITSQRTRSPKKKATNQSLIRPPAALISPTIEVQLRSTPRTPIQSHIALEKRRQKKVTVRKARAQEIAVTEVVTHISQRGRLVRYKTRD